MFVSHEVRIEVSLATACARLASLARAGGLGDASGDAYDEGFQALVRVGPLASMQVASKLVRVRVLEPVTHADQVVMPLRWEATGVTGRLFPVLDADLTLVPDGAEATWLKLTGAYRPPFSALGAALDRMALHHAATATMRSLLDRMASRITAGTAPAAEVAPAGPLPSRAEFEPGI